MATPHDVIAELRDAQHLSQLLHIARDDVQETQLVERLRVLISHLHDLVVSLFQRFFRQGVPNIREIELASTLQSDLEISATNREGEASAGFGYEVQGDILKPVSLQIAADCLRVDVAMLNDANRFSVVSFLQVFLRVALLRSSLLLKDTPSCPIRSGRACLTGQFQ